MICLNSKHMNFGTVERLSGEPQEPLQTKGLMSSRMGLHVHCTLSCPLENNNVKWPNLEF